MTKIKKVAAGILAAVSMATCVAGMSASAAPGTFDVGNGYGTLTNTSGTARYGIVSLQVVNRATGEIVKRVGSEKLLSNYSSVTATANGYTSTTYRFTGSGTLYNGTSYHTGAYWTGTDSY